MRQHVKVSSSRDIRTNLRVNLKPGIYWTETDVSSVVTPMPAFGVCSLMPTCEMGTLYGFTVVCDSYRRDDGEHYLKLAADLLEEENGRS